MKTLLSQFYIQIRLSIVVDILSVITYMKTNNLLEIVFFLKEFILKKSKNLIDKIKKTIYEKILAKNE